MGLTINTNLSSIITRKNLNNATKLLNDSIEKMTTGYKINHASDNAAGYSIAKMWQVKLSSLDVAADNTAMGSDLLKTAEESYGLLSSHLQRIRDLTEQAANGTYGSQSLKAIQSEIKARLEEVSRIASNTEYNGINLMSNGSTAAINGISLQVGLGADSNSRVYLDSSLFGSASVTGLLESFMTGNSQSNKSIKKLLNKADGGAGTTDYTIPTDLSKFYNVFAAACTGLMATSVGGDTFKLDSDTGFEARQMLTFIDKAIDGISNRVTKIGSAQNRLESATESIDVQSQNITSSLSTLRDSDVAKESSNYIKAEILQQAAATLLATANQAPSIALNLI